MTERELAVVTALSQGQHVQGIVDTIGIGINTVRKYIESFYEKLHVKTRLEAVNRLGRSIRDEISYASRACDG